MRAAVSLMGLAMVAAMLWVDRVEGQSWLTRWLRNRGGTKAKAANRWAAKKISLRPLENSKRMAMAQMNRELVTARDYPAEQLLSETDTQEQLVEENDSQEELLGATDPPEELLDVRDSPEELLDATDPPEELLDVRDSPEELLDATDPPEELLDVRDSSEELLDATDPPEELLDVRDSPEELLDATDPSEEFLDEADPPEELLDKIDPTEELLDATDPLEELLDKADIIGKPQSLERLQEVCSVLQDANCEEGLSRQMLWGAFDVVDKNANLKIDPEEFELYKRIIEYVHVCCLLNQVNAVA